MKEIKLLALDMDGTTYVKMGGVVQANVKPIQKAIAQGVEVVFATGRPALAEPNQIKENGFVAKNTLLIAYNGGGIFDLKQQKMIQVNPIDSQIGKKVFLIAVKPEYQKTFLWGYVTSDLNTVLTNAKNPSSKDKKPLFYSLEMNFFDGQYLTVTPDMLESFNYQFFKFLVFDAQPNFLKELEELGLEVASSDGVNAEVTAHQINKKFALQWVGEQLKIASQFMMAIGDGANDISMIEYVGVGVALKNSIPAVKKIADIYVDLTNEQGAVGYAIENYVKRRKMNDES